MRKLNWKKILVRAFWLLSGIGMIVLLGAAMQKKNQKHCADIKIEIVGKNRHLFIDEKDVLEILNAAQPVKSSSVADINLRALESLVEKNAWVSNAEMYIDNNQVLQVKIEERQPVARVFTLQGNSFYLDSGCMRLPLSDKLSARVPVFTGFPSDKEVLAKPDSLLLRNVVKMGEYIVTDSFWMAQVSQLDITPQGGFEIVPVIGDQTIVFGEAENIDAKFSKLLVFYQKAWLQNGINTYEKLDLQYNNQIVAVRKGTAKATVDSLKAMQLLQGMLANKTMELNDSSTSEEMKRAVRLSGAADSLSKKKRLLPETTAIKPIAKTNSVNEKNNKTGTKPLSNGIKPATKNKNQKKKQATPKTNQPKAVMDKNKNAENN